MTETFNKELIRIGEQIKKLRKRKDYSQETLAEAIGVSVMTISRIENGSAAMSIQILIKLARVLEVPVQVIMCEADTVA